MLIRIDDTYVIKSDTYQFQLCEDKGLTRFPNGVESMYYKPLYFYGKICLVIEKLMKLGIDVPDWCKKILEIDRNIDLFSKNEFDFEELEIGDIRLKKEGTHNFVVKYGTYNTYPTSCSHAIYFIWQMFLRTDNVFGTFEGQVPNFASYGDIEKASREFMNKLSGLIPEKVVN